MYVEIDDDLISEAKNLFPKSVVPSTHKNFMPGRLGRAFTVIGKLKVPLENDFEQFLERNYSEDEVAVVLKLLFDAENILEPDSTKNVAIYIDGSGVVRGSNYDNIVKRIYDVIYAKPYPVPRLP